MAPNEWGLFWLGVIGISLAVATIIQIAAIFLVVSAARTARQAAKTMHAQISPLINRTQTLVIHTTDVVDRAREVVLQLDGVTSNIGVQIEHVRSAVDVASDRVTELYDAVRRITGRAEDMLADARGLWTTTRTRARAGSYDPPLQ